MVNSQSIQLLLPPELQKDLDRIKTKLEELEKNFQPKQPTKYLTRNEVAKMLKINLSTVHNWTKKGILTGYYIQGRVYYKRAEVENAIVELKY